MYVDKINKNVYIVEGMKIVSILEKSLKIC